MVQKLPHMGQYDAVLAKVEADNARVDSGEMTKAEFIAMNSRLVVDSGVIDSG